MRGAVAAGVLTVVVLIGAGGGYLLGSTNERTSTTTDTKLSSITFIHTSTIVSTMTATLMETTTQHFFNQWYGLNFMGNESNCAVSTNPPTTWYETPCFGPNADAAIFNCAAAAASQQGCTQRINTTGQATPQPSGPNYFVVTIWNPYMNDTVYPGMNCRYSVPSVPTPPGPVGPYYAYCISINATAFIVSDLAPGPL